MPSVRTLVASAAIVLASPAVVAGAPVESASSVSAKCAEGHSVDARLGAKDFALVKRFVACVGKEISPGQGGFDELGGLPGVVRVFKTFANAPEAKHTPSFIAAQLAAATYRTDGRKHTLNDGCFAYSFGDTTPKSPSLADVADSIMGAQKTLVKSITDQGTFLRTTALVQRGSWFHGGRQRHNVRYAFVFAGSRISPGSC